MTDARNYFDKVVKHDIITYEKLRQFDYRKSRSISK